jgi:hypothetical protein
VLNSVLNVLVKLGMCNGQYLCLHIHYLIDMSLFNDVVFVTREYYYILLLVVVLVNV